MFAIRNGMAAILASVNNVTYESYDMTRKFIQLDDPSLLTTHMYMKFQVHF